MKRLWDPYAPENISNPYQMYNRMRSQSPVFLAQTGEWVLTRYNDVFDILENSNFRVGNRLEWMKRQQNYLNDDRYDFQTIIDAMHRFLVLLDPPEHTRVRELVAKAWSDQNVEAIINDNINELLAKVGSDFDLVKDFAMPLPVMTICKIMGIEVSEMAKLKALSEKMVQSLNLYSSLKELVTISEASEQFIDFFKKYINYRKGHLEDDLVSRILFANQEHDQPLNDSELISICIFLFVAGEETTVNLISSGMRAMFQNPAFFNQFKESSELQGEMINELLRYDAPVQLVGRIALSDYQIKDNLISAGSTVTLSIGAANRDPIKFKNPNDLSIDRDFKKNLSFGRGKHFCLGSSLAKKQTSLAIGKLISTFPDISLLPQHLKWNDHLAVRGLQSLMVRTK